MKNSKSKHKFRASVGDDFGTKMVTWKLELFFSLFFILASFSPYPKLAIEEGFSAWLGAPLFGTIVLYFLITGVLEWFEVYLIMRDEEIRSLEQKIDSLSKNGQKQ
ncbi:MAG: hypothetical protein ABIG61_08720 [Planctomycetota bacterium]